MWIRSSNFVPLGAMRENQVQGSWRTTRKTHDPKQIVALLRQIDVELADRKLHGCDRCWIVEIELNGILLTSDPLSRFLMGRFLSCVKPAFLHLYPRPAVAA